MSPKARKFDGLRADLNKRLDQMPDGEGQAIRARVTAKFDAETAESMKGIRLAAKRRDRADQARRHATDQLRECAREAQSAGVPIAQIAREAGLSRQGVYDLLGDRRPS